MDLPYLHKQLNNLNSEISYILSRTGFDGYGNMTNVEFDKNNPDAIFLKNEFAKVMNHFEEIKNTLDYLKKDVVGEYTLHKNLFGKYECEEQEFHCNNTIEYYCYDDWYECYKWVVSRVEHDGNDYYIVGNRDISLNGLKVRVRR